MPSGVGGVVIVVFFAHRSCCPMFLGSTLSVLAARVCADSPPPIFTPAERVCGPSTHTFLALNILPSPCNQLHIHCRNRPLRPLTGGQNRSNKRPLSTHCHLCRITTAGVSKYPLYILCPLNPSPFQGAITFVYRHQGRALHSEAIRKHDLAKAWI